MAVEEGDQRRINGEEEADEENEEEQRFGVEYHDGPSHNPSPPHDELFDISTAVDPSYIISLIRKLLPIGAASDGFVPKVDQLGNQGLCSEHIDDNVMPQSVNNVLGNSNGSKENMEIVDDANNRNGEHSMEVPCRATSEEAWEEYGCILWDLSASRTHAELMVENLIVEVLFANLAVSQSVRVTEICLGIVGNLACHEVGLKNIVSEPGLVDAIVEQLFLDDTQCLNEACRILTSGLLGTESSLWAKKLQHQHLLQRLLWITENALNPQLIEKIVGLLLSIIEGQTEVQQLLLPHLMNLGLGILLINLLSYEMAKLRGERLSERYAVLDVFLRAIEALSVIDGYSEGICSNTELFQLVCDLIKLPDKAEMETSCVTAGVLTANILSEKPELAAELSDDFAFLQGVLDILQIASDDLEAKRAVWHIIARLLGRVQEAEISTESLDHYVRVLVSKSDLIEDDLLDLQIQSDVSNQENESSDPSQTKSSAREIAIQKIILILNQWNAKKGFLEHNADDGSECTPSKHEAKRLLDCCCRYIKQT